MAGILIFFTTAFFLFVGAVMSVLIGGCVGWVVQGVFPYVIETINMAAKMQLTGFEIGATLGFVGAFFRTTVNR